MEKCLIDSEFCKGCGLCVSVCPKGLIVIQKSNRNKKGYFTALCADQSACVSCASCAVVCPDCAITVMKEEQ